MGRIRVLRAQIVDRIAAGEVVERPASIVKELVENSLDAGAGRVDIRVENGGRTLVEVSDDGHGMSRADAELAFTQHATSKIRELGDLDRIETLGFRGEALASIAAVGLVELVSGVGEGPATRVVVEGAAPIVSGAGASRGTRIRVRDLFYSTPARRKHLRTDATEFAQIAAVVQQFALLRPDVAFSLTHDGRERLVAAPVAGLEDRVHQVLGEEVAGAWLPVSDAGTRVTVTGGGTDPEQTRADRRGIYLFVNGRAIADGRLSHAVVSAYGTLLDRGRYPVAALFLQLPPSDVDVNVHPRKAEVRFVEPGRVYGSLRRAVQRALAAHVPPPLLQATTPVAGVPEAAVRESAPPTWGGATSLPLRDWREVHVPEASGASVPLPGPIVSPIAGTSGAIQPLGQYANTYILAADDEGLLVIDQHVAHERILFEQILAQRSRQSLPVQRLLVPETLDLSAEEVATAEAHASRLATFGFEIEPFGGNTWAIRAVPELLQKRSAEPVVRALLAELGREAGAQQVEKLHQELAASIACHSAVRANQPLSADVMGYLIRELGGCEAPNRCPHGRPVMLRLAHSEIEKRLKRH